ncbi:MAG: polyphosphate polymerase domain-containing protein [Lachnospiraceae bacterium]|nr:polyphosphate polymerase domain-containing protein [Lachnospiraceae bacterium]
MCAEIYRHEDKYIINRMQAEILKQRARAVMRPDAHTRPDGLYSVRSLYFDDINNSCYRESGDGTDPRAKFRIRIYNEDKNYIRLEKKIKKRGLCRKLSAMISEEECRMLMAGRIPKFTGDEGQGSAKAGAGDAGYQERLSAEAVKRQLFSELEAKNLRPVVIISYDRLPFIYPFLNIRFTIDTGLFYSENTDSFLEKETRFGIPAMRENDDYGIMELKWDDMVPLHLKDYLSIETLIHSRFSKYYYCRSDQRGI